MPRIKEAVEKPDEEVERGVIESLSDIDSKKGLPGQGGHLMETINSEGFDDERLPKDKKPSRLVENAIKANAQEMPAVVEDVLSDINQNQEEAPPEKSAGIADIKKEPLDIPVPIKPKKGATKN